jgi:hypothetical protein
VDPDDDEEGIVSLPTDVQKYFMQVADFQVVGTNATGSVKRPLRVPV